jgi:hypothetical protein
MRKEIYESKQLLIENCGTGRVYVRANEKEITVSEPVRISVDEIKMVDKTKYQYDEVIVSVNSFSEDNVLEALRQQILKCISDYDSSDKVNSFTINGMKYWLDKETRAGLMLRFNAEKQSGKTDTTLWAGNVCVPLAIDKAIQMLYALEVYASACYDMTSSHRANVSNLKTIDEVMNYDYTSGYPSKLTF